MSARAGKAGAKADLGKGLKTLCAELGPTLKSAGELRFKGTRNKLTVDAHTASLVCIVAREAIENAFLHAHPAGVACRISVTSEQNRRGNIVIAVSDDGVGLPENFDPLVDGENGFHLMRAIGEKLGATLTFKSTPLGLLMRLRLPGTARKRKTARHKTELSQRATIAGGQDAQQTALHELTDGLFRATSLKDVYSAAFDTIRRALGCQRASILLFDPDGVMRFKAWRGLSDSYRAAVEGHSPWTRDAADAQPICIEDIATADLDAPLKSVVQAEGIRALAFVPVVAAGELVGKFMTYYDTPHAFSSTEINFAITIARQLGFGIERTRSELTNRLSASIIENSDDAIVSKNLSGIITSWNQGAERIFGYSAAEAVGNSIMMLIPSERSGEEPEIIGRIQRGERVDHYETVRRRKDGSLIDVSLTVSPLKDNSGTVVGASKIARDITERKHAQARQDLLTQEVQHRTKNLFAVVLAVVARSFTGKQTAKEAEVAVLERLRSLAQTHALLMDTQWQGADLADVVRSEMSPYADRIQIEGPELILSARAAQNFALALHELATNAAKHGALSNPAGRVHISWSVARSHGSGQFKFRWQEHGGPQVSPPARKGFGSTVLEQVMAEYFDAPPRIEFAPEGVNYELHGSIEAVSPSIRAVVAPAA